MNSIGNKSIGFEDQTAETIDPGAKIESGPNPKDPNEAPEQGENDEGDIHEFAGVDAVEEWDEAIRVLEEADLEDNFEEEQREDQTERGLPDITGGHGLLTIPIT